MRTRAAVASTLLAAAAGCASCDSVPANAVTDCNMQIVPGAAASDLLFIVDDSGSMNNKQQALADNLSTFIDALLASPVALDLRVGVTNTSIDDYSGAVAYGTPDPTGAAYPGPRGAPFPFGKLVAIAQDGSGVGQFGHFMWGIAYDPAHLTSAWGGPRILSSGPDLARDFKANVHQGDWGSGKEQPLRAMRASLDASMVTTGTNFGLLRSGARLAVVILTDEDDCSESGTPKQVTSDNVCHSSPVDWRYFDPLNEFVDYLDTTVGAISGEPPIVAVIAGFDAAGTPSGCSGTFTSSANPRRLAALLDRLDAAHPGRTDRLSICQPFGDALLSIASLVIPQTMPLEQSPADYRMLAVSVVRGGSSIPCPLDVAGSAGAATAAVVYAPAPPGGLPTLTFQNACRLTLGDQVDLRIVCVR